MRVAPVSRVWPLAPTAQRVFCRRAGDLTRVDRTRNRLCPAPNCGAIANGGEILGPRTSSPVDKVGPVRSGFRHGQSVLDYDRRIVDATVNDRRLHALAVGKRARAQGTHGDTRALPVEPCRSIDRHACADTPPGRLKCPKAQTVVAGSTHHRPGAGLVVDSASREGLRWACALSAVCRRRSSPRATAGERYRN